MRAWLIPLVITLGLASSGRSAEHLTLYAGESKVLDLEDARRLVTGNPSLLEARSLDEHQILLNARQTGQTSLLVWDRLGQKKAFEVEILSAGLKRAMIEIDVQVLEIGDGVKWDVGLDWAGTLQGQAASTFPASAVSVLEVSPPLLSFGTFQRGPIGARLDALIQDNKARLMAKPRLVTVSGGKARFLSGGQVPVADRSAG